jgi:Protein of unknown function (DUF4058)
MAEFWPFGLRDPLPTISIPLRPGDSDARLDLRSILDRVYDESAYENYIYQRPPEPPLSADDATWARALLPPSLDLSLVQFAQIPPLRVVYDESSELIAWLRRILARTLADRVKHLRRNGRDYQGVNFPGKWRGFFENIWRD